MFVIILFKRGQFSILRLKCVFIGFPYSSGSYRRNMHILFVINAWFTHKTRYLTTARKIHWLLNTSVYLFRGSKNKLNWASTPWKRERSEGDKKNSLKTRVRTMPSFVRPWLETVMGGANTTWLGYLFQNTKKCLTDRSIHSQLSEHEHMTPLFSCLIVGKKHG